MDESENLLRAPSNTQYPTLARAQTSYTPLNIFTLDKGEDKLYQQQYGDMYFLRLAKLKPAVEKVAEEWEGYKVAGETVHRVDRVLDVRQGELCWIVGTVYMDMPLKPNILDDISKDHWVAAPPPREKYVSQDGKDQVMLEDESGRLRLTGSALENTLLVTGCVVGVMGTENANGDFEVIDLKVPDLPQHPAPAEETPSLEDGTKVAVISGLDITGTSGDSLALDLLTEYLVGESSSPSQQSSASKISRLIIAGNSLAEANPLQPIDENRQPSTTAATKRTPSTAAPKRYGYDASAYNPAPTTQLDTFLASILPSLPVTLLPGATDPANVSLPQQPLHPALFPQSRAYAAGPSSTRDQNQNTSQSASFHPATNPAIFTVGDKRILVTAGQPTLDIAKYVPGPSDSDGTEGEPSALDLMEATLRWRLVAPTCPDTLWCFPYKDDDPFVLGGGECPHFYFAGNQARFGTRVVVGGGGEEAESDEGGRSGVRVVSVPKFSETGECVLVDLKSGDVEVLRFAVHEESSNGVEDGVKDGGEGDADVAMDGT